MSTEPMSTEQTGGEETADTQPGAGKRLRILVGRVVSNKMDKSVTVLVERRVPHPVYGKYIRRTSKIIAHDEDNACAEGDTVTIAECRPISKRKSWRVVGVESGERAAG